MKLINLTPHAITLLAEGFAIFDGLSSLVGKACKCRCLKGGYVMDNLIGYLMMTAIAVVSVFLVWLLIVGICVIADCLGVY